MSLKQLQQDAKSRIESFSAKLREQIAMEPLTSETNFSKAFDNSKGVASSCGDGQYNIDFTKQTFTQDDFINSKIKSFSCLV